MTTRIYQDENENLPNPAAGKQGTHGIKKLGSRRAVLTDMTNNVVHKPMAFKKEGLSQNPAAVHKKEKSWGSTTSESTEYSSVFSETDLLIDLCEKPQRVIVVDSPDVEMKDASFSTAGGSAREYDDSFDEYDTASPERRSQQDGPSRDPLDVHEYVDDIHENYKRLESLRSLRADYMEDQDDINPRMRSILVDWLVDVHAKFKLEHETLYLTVYLIDRYLDQVSVNRERLQLVGVTGLLIASKYEEIYPPELKDLVYITDDAYTKEEILEMEQDMLEVLEFRLTTSSPLHFLSQYLRVANHDEDEASFHMAQYICERTLQEYRFLKYSPSIIACTAILFMRIFSQVKVPWCESLEEKAGYKAEDLLPCLEEMKEMMKGVGNAISSTKAVKKKYSNTKYMQVATRMLPLD